MAYAAKNRLLLAALFLVILTPREAAAGKDWVNPREVFPEIQTCYAFRKGDSCITSGGSIWFLALSRDTTAQLYPPVKTPLFLRYDLKLGTFEALYANSKDIPHEVAAYWESKAVTYKDSGWCRRNDDACSLSQVIHTNVWGKYEVKSTALLHYDPWYPTRLFFPLPLTKEEIRRYGLIVYCGNRPEEEKQECETKDAKDWIDALLGIEKAGESMPSGELAGDAVFGPGIELGNKLFLGLVGGFPEGYGSFGGLAIFDLPTKQWEIIRDPMLLDSTVTSIVSDGKATLWLGTLGIGEYDIYGNSGLVSYYIPTKSLRSYTTKNSNITGDIINMVKYVPPYLWVATEYGMDRINLETDEWKNYKWRYSPNRTPHFDLLEVPNLINGKGQAAGEHDFLKYSKPSFLINHFSYEAGSRQIGVEVFYGKTIKPGTFTAVLDGKDVSRLFTPKPAEFDKAEFELEPDDEGQKVTHALVLSVEGMGANGNIERITDRFEFIFEAK